MLLSLYKTHHTLDDGRDVHVPGLDWYDRIGLGRRDIAAEGEQELGDLGGRVEPGPHVSARTDDGLAVTPDDGAVELGVVTGSRNGNQHGVGVGVTYANA